MARIAVVTGSGQGLGEEIVMALAKRDYRLALLGRTASKIERVASQIGHDALPITLDLTDAGAVRHAFAQVEAHFGAIDVLVNNAATYVPFLLADATDDQLRDTVDGTLMSALYCIREAIKVMQPRGTGDIVSITSESVHYPAPMLSIYAAAKAGLAKVHEALHRELTGTGIRTMVFETARIDSSSTGENWTPELLAEFARRWSELGYAGPLANQPVSARTLAATVAHMIDAPREAMLDVRMRSPD